MTPPAHGSDGARPAVCSVDARRRHVSYTATHATGRREREWGEVETCAIHRLIEEHAAARPDAIAISDAASAITYRELNYRANAAARYLIAHGLRRGEHAIVTMERGIALATVLLGTLKAGASYEWVEPVGPCFSRTVVIRPCGSGRSSDHEPSLTIALDDLLATPPQPSPNLPVLTRGSDIACVLRGDGDAINVLVPHATVVALHHEGAPTLDEWTGDAGTLDLWLALMAGATVRTLAPASLTPAPAIAAGAYRAA